MEAFDKVEIYCGFEAETFPNWKLGICSMHSNYNKNTFMNTNVHKIDLIWLLYLIL